MGSKNGGLRITQKAQVDRISSLPDDVLSLILSLLPTKWAVGTSILSKRWKYRWTFITCLDFKNHTDSLGNNNAVEFTNFVGHVFRSCNPKHIQKLILHFPWLGADESSIETWIDVWMKGKVSELDLYVYKLPLSVFSCTTLTVLTLGPCDNYDAEVVSFNLPRLKVLHLNVIFSRFMENLIKSCPVLEDLTLGGISAWYIANNFMVSAHTLKTLRLQLIQNCIANYSRYITIEAPNLEYLYFSELFIDYKIKGILSSVVKAYVNIGYIYMGHLFQRPPRRWTLPNCPSLTCMEVISCDNRFWAMLLKFISRTPSLEVLSLKQDGHALWRDDGYDWAEPKVVPKCVGHHLGIIKVEGFKGRKHELHLLKYFLGNANVLKTLSVNRQELTPEEEIKLVGQLQEFSRASKDCKIEFHGNVMLSRTYRVID